MLALRGVDFLTRLVASEFMVQHVLRVRLGLV